MVKKNLIIFDLDDTLVDTSDLYWKARSCFVKKLTEKGVDENTLVEEFERIDSIHIKQFGFAPNRYEKTMFATLESFFPQSKYHLSEELISYIKSCGRLILDGLPKPIEGAKELLQWASKHYRLAVITRGEFSFQIQKLTKLQILHYFDFIRVVQKKDVNVFRKFLEEIDYPPCNTWIVGDSIKSDINPGIEVGATCILYAYKHPHYYWIQDSENYTLGYFYKVDSLHDIKKLLESPTAFDKVTEV